MNDQQRARMMRGTHPPRKGEGGGVARCYWCGAPLKWQGRYCKMSACQRAKRRAAARESGHQGRPEWTWLA